MTNRSQLMCMNMAKWRIFVVCLALAVVGIYVFYVQRNDFVLQEKSHSNQTYAQKIIYSSPIIEKVSAEPNVVLMTNLSIPNSMPASNENTILLTRHVSCNANDNDAALITSDKNQIMDALLDQPQIPADYADVMIGLYRDSTHDVVTRDFAVQHIGLYAQALNRRGLYDPKSAEAERCRAALYDAADETRTIVAAAAFRALSDVSEFDSCISARRLNNALVRCASDDTASLAARIMAVQLCGERQVKESKESLRSIVSSSSTSKPLRLAARHSIGILN